MVHLSDFRIDSRIQRLAGALAERGDEVDLIGIGERDELRVGDGVIRIHPVGGSKPAGSPGAYLRGYGHFLLRAAACISTLDLRHRFDVIEAHNMPNVLTAAAVLPRIRGRAMVLNVHDTFPELFATKFARQAADPIVRLVEAEERLGAALATDLVTVTTETQRRLESRRVGVGRTIVVMNSPDERVFGPPRPPLRLPADGPIRMLYHGGIDDRFGVETLIRAFARLRHSAPRLQLRICGTGGGRARLAQLAAEIAPDRIELTPEPVPFAAIPGELRAAHIGVVPTHADAFTELLLPVKLLEYVHMGLPTLASRLQGIACYFPGSELTTFSPGDPGALAAAAEAVCADPVSAQARAAQAGRRLEHIAWRHQRERYLNLVDSLAAARPGR